MAASEEARHDAAIRRLTWVAAAVAAVVAVALPAIYFTVSYRHLAGALEKEAEVNAYLISQRVVANPLGWRYEQYRLLELFEAVASQEGHLYRILDSGNRLIVKYGEDVPFPAMTVREGIFDSGEAVGWVEIRRSLRGVALRTLLAALLGAALGGLIFAAFRALPLRSLKQAWRDLYRSGQFVQGILASASDAILSLDAGGRVVFANR